LHRQGLDRAEDVDGIDGRIEGINGSRVGRQGGGEEKQRDGGQPACAFGRAEEIWMRAG
jgi:hypothetical protein